MHQEQLVCVSADSDEVEEVLELVLSHLVIKLHYCGIQEVSRHGDLCRLAHVLLQDLFPGLLVGPLSAIRVFDLLGQLHKQLLLADSQPALLLIPGGLLLAIYGLDVQLRHHRVQVGEERAYCDLS